MKYLLEKFDWFIYHRAYKSLERLSKTSIGFVYLLELWLGYWREKYGIPDSLKSSTENFFRTQRDAFEKVKNNMKDDYWFAKIDWELSSIEWTEEEIFAIRDICKKQCLTPTQVMRQALRTYQLVATGYSKPVEVNPISKAPEYEEFEMFYEHCDKDTLHKFRSGGHERDSSHDYSECLECKWYKFGMSGEYQEPFSERTCDISIGPHKHPA